MLSCGTARGEVVEDVGGAADVVVVRDTAADPHATVERRRDEDHLVMTARRVEALPLAVLFARRCSVSSSIIIIVIVIVIIYYLKEKLSDKRNDTVKIVQAIKY